MFLFYFPSCLDMHFLIAFLMFLWMTERTKEMCRTSSKEYNNNCFPLPNFPPSPCVMLCQSGSYLVFPPTVLYSCYYSFSSFRNSSDFYDRVIIIIKSLKLVIWLELLSGKCGPILLEKKEDNHYCYESWSLDGGCFK